MPRLADIRNFPLSNIFSYELLKTNEGLAREHTEIILKKGNLWPLSEDSEFRIVSPQTFVGLEVEVEGMIAAVHEHSLKPLWRIVPDGSLRNNGVEFVSSPIRGNAIPAALIQLSEYLNTVQTKHNFSTRTSVHAHINMRTATAEHLMNLLMVYLVFEPTLYAAVFNTLQKKRDDNIFCLPLGHSLRLLDLQGIFSQWESGNLEIISLIPDLWKKYTGLNLTPLKGFGTIEFRQLGGTANVPKIIEWLNLILSIKDYAITHSYEDIQSRILELNTTSMYDVFTRDVFGKYAQRFIGHNLQSELERGAIFVKYVLSSASGRGDSQVFNEETFQKDLVKNFDQSSFKKYLMAQGCAFSPKPPRAKRVNVLKKKPLSELGYDVLEKEYFDITDILIQTQTTPEENDFDRIEISTYQIELSKYRAEILAEMGFRRV